MESWDNKDKRNKFKSLGTLKILLKGIWKQKHFKIENLEKSDLRTKGNLNFIKRKKIFELRKSGTKVPKQWIFRIWMLGHQKYTVAIANNEWKRVRGF